MQISGIQQHLTKQTGLARFANQSAPISKKNQLSDQDEKKLETLKKRDAEVKQHENAHEAAAGQYAIGGEVNIDTSEISGDPGKQPSVRLRPFGELH